MRFYSRTKKARGYLYYVCVGLKRGPERRTETQISMLHELDGRGEKQIPVDVI